MSILCSKMTGRSELVVSCVAASETRASDHISRSVIITTTDSRPLQIQIVGHHTLASTKGSLAEKKVVVSKKTKKIETRVQRQVVLEDGRVVADTGPQVITRTLEDEDTENKDCDSKCADLLNNYQTADAPWQSDPFVVRTISRTQTTRRSASKEVNHYHDEERRDVTSAEELERGIRSPQDLLDKIENEFPEAIKGELKFYSNRSKDFVCQERVNEVSRLDADGNLRTATTVTHHEEEKTEDELPEQHVPRALPDLSGARVEWPESDPNARIVPVLTQEPRVQSTTHPFSKSGSHSALFSEVKKTGMNSCSERASSQKDGLWTVERKQNEGGESELVSVKRNTASGIWQSYSSIANGITRPSSPSKVMPQFPATQRKVLDRVIANNEKTTTRKSLNGKRAAERRQRGVFLDGHESCPSPPMTAVDEENHYELLWDARTGERRSPSPTKSETFTRARGRRIAQMLAQRRATSKRAK